VSWKCTFYCGENGPSLSQTNFWIEKLDKTTVNRQNKFIAYKVV
jgi:hypothetical protein